MNRPIPINDLGEGRDMQVQRDFGGGAIQQITAAEIDIQISTAKRYPRSITTFMRTVNDLVQMNEDIAAGCIYALPRGGKNIEGPSARFAEIILSSWGNCRAASRPIAEDDEYVTVQGVFTDLERNTAVGAEVKRRITDKNGNRFNADMIAVTINAAGSIAIRNAILKGIPKVYWEHAYRAARSVIVGDSKTLANKRSSALALMQQFGATPEQVYEKLGIKGVEEIMEDQLITLRGYVTAMRDGESSVEDIFGPTPTGKKAETPKDVTAGDKQPPATEGGAQPPPAVEKPKDAPPRELTPYEKLLEKITAAKDAETVSMLLDVARKGMPEIKASGDDAGAPEVKPLAKAEQDKLGKAAKVRLGELESGQRPAIE